MLFHRSASPLLAVLLAWAQTSSAAAAPDHGWLIGDWEKTQDEDKWSPPDKMKFRADGTWIAYGPKGEERVLPYHFFHEDLYLTIEMPGKGPVALVFRPSKDHKSLVFTSPRTINNAVYERVDRGGAVGER